ncbi:hypothetical protein IRJ41_004245 [Triplophysa rosa]|uniref:Uncharacterized protein n=1 Tax=Triplophysa rosa TaxID=992332 RepID=A0A9W7WTL3_TRIRA|nr:hypothetical protein IRJ41_004245 [Triplophysa rosa]
MMNIEKLSAVTGSRCPHLDGTFSCVRGEEGLRGGERVPLKMQSRGLSLAPTRGFDKLMEIITGIRRTQDGTPSDRQQFTGHLTHTAHKNGKRCIENTSSSRLIG